MSARPGSAACSISVPAVLWIVGSHDILMMASYAELCIHESGTSPPSKVYNNVVLYKTLGQACALCTAACSNCSERLIMTRRDLHRRQWTDRCAPQWHRGDSCAKVSEGMGCSYLMIWDESALRDIGVQYITKNLAKMRLFFPRWWRTLTCRSPIWGPELDINYCWV